MRWKSVAVAGAFWPAAAGCNIAHYAARNIVNEPHVVWTQHAIAHDLRKSARSAWEEVKGQCPEYAASAEYRDGFVDGYVDYLDRGGEGTLPAVPPAKYTRHKKYFTETGQCLVKVYFLGFKHGQEVAIASGRRELLTVPVLLPQQPTGPVAFNVQPAPGHVPPPMMPYPTPPDTGTAAAPAKEVRVASEPPPAVATPTVPIAVPVPQAPPEPLPPLSKGAPPPGFEPTPKPPPTEERAGTDPPRPAPKPVPARPPVSTPVSVPALPDRVGPRRWGDLPPIPTVPAEAAPGPVTPTDGPTPRVLPPNHTVRPPLPPNHPKPHE
jgi:hypothetical protein